MIITQAARPAGTLLRRIARQNTAAARNQQKREAVPATQQFRHPVEGKPLADSAQIKLQPPTVALNGKLLRQQIPLRQRGLRLQGSGRGRKPAERGPLHLLCDCKAGKGRLAQAPFFSRLKPSDLSYGAVDAKPA